MARRIAFPEGEVKRIFGKDVLTQRPQSTQRRGASTTDFTDDTDMTVFGLETLIAPLPHPCYPRHPWCRLPGLSPSSLWPPWPLCEILCGPWCSRPLKCAVSAVQDRSLTSDA